MNKSLYCVLILSTILPLNPYGADIQKHPAEKTFIFIVFMSCFAYCYPVLCMQLSCSFKAPPYYSAHTDVQKHTNTWKEGLLLPYILPAALGPLPVNSCKPRAAVLRSALLRPTALFPWQPPSRALKIPSTYVCRPLVEAREILCAHNGFWSIN